MKSELEFKNLIEKSKKVVALEDADKEAIRSNVMAFMKEHPVKEMPMQNPNRLASWSFLSTFNKPVLRYASMISVVALLFGYGAYAAQGSLPGDSLYPVKVHINEKVAGLFLTSDEAKAKYQVQLTQLRLEEIEEIALKGKTDEKTNVQVKTLLDGHITKAKKYSANVKVKDQISALDIESNLEASLNAHSQILNRLEHAKNVLDDVNDKIGVIQKSRQANEEALSKEKENKKLAGVRTSAEGKLRAATNKVAEVTNFLNDKKSSLSEESYALAQENLKLAGDAIAQGQHQLQLEEWSNAFASFQKAMRIAESAKINAATSIKLRIELPRIPQKQPVEEDDDEKDDSVLDVKNSLNIKLGN